MKDDGENRSCGAPKSPERGGDEPSGGKGSEKVRACHSDTHAGDMTGNGVVHRPLRALVRCDRCMVMRHVRPGAVRGRRGLRGGVMARREDTQRDVGGELPKQAREKIAEYSLCETIHGERDRSEGEAGEKQPSGPRRHSSRLSVRNDRRQEAKEEKDNSRSAFETCVGRWPTVT